MPRLGHGNLASSLHCLLRLRPGRRRSSHEPATTVRVRSAALHSRLLARLDLRQQAKAATPNMPSPQNQLPITIQEPLAHLPEHSYGAVRVTVVLDDGSSISDVYVAWGSEVVRVGDRADIPFDPSRVVEVHHQP